MEFFTPGHIIVLVIIGVALYFGGNKIPDMARSVGKSLKVFRDEVKGFTADIKDDDSGSTSSSGDQTPKAIEAPAAEPAPRVIARPSEPVAVRAEVVRDGSTAGTTSRPRPRPTSSAAQR